MGLDSRDNEAGGSDARTEREGRRAFKEGRPPPLVVKQNGQHVERVFGGEAFYLVLKKGLRSAPSEIPFAHSLPAPATVQPFTQRPPGPKDGDTKEERRWGGGMSNPILLQ